MMHPDESARTSPGIRPHSRGPLAADPGRRSNPNRPPAARHDLARSSTHRRPRRTPFAPHWPARRHADR